MFYRNENLSAGLSPCLKADRMSSRGSRQATQRGPAATRKFATRNATWHDEVVVKWEGEVAFLAKEAGGGRSSTVLRRPRINYAPHKVNTVEPAAATPTGPIKWYSRRNRFEIPLFHWRVAIHARKSITGPHAKSNLCCAREDNHL